MSTICGTGSVIINDPIAGGVTMGSNLFLLYECKSAKTAYRSGSHTALGTSSLITGNVNTSVSKSLDKNITASFTYLRIKAGCVYTGGMTEGITVDSTTGSASLGSNTISVYPIVAERLTNLKGADLTGLRSGTGSIDKRVCAKSSHNSNGIILGKRRMLERIGSYPVLCDIFNLG
jgi:hypothetical protein